MTNPTRSFPVLILAFFALGSISGCDSKGRLEKLAIKTIVAENAKLPVSVGHSVQLASVAYDSFFNEIELRHDVLDREEFDRNYKAIESNCHSRIKSHKSFMKLLDKKVRIIHQFRGGAREGETPTHTEFVTES